jgi:hypothetical protein
LRTQGLLEIPETPHTVEIQGQPWNPAIAGLLTLDVTFHAKPAQRRPW